MNAMVSKQKFNSVQFPLISAPFGFQAKKKELENLALRSWTNAIHKPHPPLPFMLIAQVNDSCP